MRRKNMMRRNLTQTIRHSLGRYIAIVAIIALGAGLFTGLKVTKVDMVATVQSYTDRQNMFDVQVMNSYGWTEDDVLALSKTEGIADCEGTISLDVLVHMGNEEDSAFKVLSIPERLNLPALDAGRMPAAPDECLVEGYFFDKNIIGKTLYISKNNTDTTLEAFAYDAYTIVGTVSSPMYLNMQRGSTSIGSGAISAYCYVPRDGIAQEIYTEINLTLEGEHKVYSDAYDNAMDRMAERLEVLCEPLARKRFETVRADAEAEYADGMSEYLDGVAEYREARDEALLELNKAELEILDGEQQIADNRKLLEDGMAQMDEAQKTLTESRAALAQSRLTLANTRSETYAQLTEGSAELMKNYKEALAGKQQVDAGLIQIESGLAQLESGLSQIESGLSLIQIMLPILETSRDAAQRTLDAAVSAGADETTLSYLQSGVDDLNAQLDEYTAQRDELLATQAQVQQQYEEVLAQKTELLATQTMLQNGIETIELGFRELEQGRINADSQFAAAEAQIEAGELQLEEGQKQLDERRAEAEAGLIALEEAEKELAEGRATFESEKEKAMQELSDAEAELEDARLQLEDARKTIDELSEPDIFALTRNTNLGYVVFESDSDIVAGVAKIFPVFFLAVAALVCITTMTRMIDEERTQIGILKALGYAPGAIMGKYLGYSVSASLMGCVLGLMLGCFVFPAIIWYAYCIMYNFSPQLTLSYDLPTFLFIFVSYTGLTGLVTWYCCRRELKEVPAELIRPKAPAAGKALFFENMAFWKRMSFLNKVAIRNIFRYKQRLAMMLLGIGGCTALLVTGFGLQDSIKGITDKQFGEVTVYDMAVTFADPLTKEEQEDFRSEIRSQTDRVLFCEQGSVDLYFDNSVKNVYFLASDSDLEGVIDLHSGDKPVSMPAENEVVLSIGVARNMDIAIGDRVTLRTSDMEELELTVSGIYDNHVYNYAIVSGSTLRAQWDRSPEEQSALVLAAAEQDLHQLGAAITGYSGVLNVNINADTAGQVGSMMDALDAVIVLIVICAGLLAGIVLYNLTNINIKERIREIATIKVLGFNARETGSYVFKENLALTAMGTFLGLFGGKWLHAAVMGYVRIDMVWFGNIIHFKSYVISAVLTIVAALIVDAVMYFQLEKINMAEALKSVE
ncbi:MAG: FtsX-like permease family protein [Oscillospiraceae bacterium]|nr:FtsX-like permease family protein [Oscillospiraceae bacterium]